MDKRKRPLRLSASTSEDEDSDFSPVPNKRPPPHWRDQDRGGASSTPPPTSSSRSSFQPVKEKKAPSFVDAKAEKMMKMMGYKSGTGLGKHNQGRVAPVELSTQRGRRGLGLRLEGLEPANLEWDSSQEVVEVEEQVKWLTEDAHVPISLPQLKAWMKEGPRKMELDGETEFCDADVLRNVLSSKTVFDRLDKHELMKARTRSNPFETIGRGMFLNRAAMKMANMDAVFEFMFTNPKHMDSSSMLSSDDLLYFADVCAGPGGFSEYVLWRKNWEAKGFGMTLRDSNDFRLEDFHAAPCETFEPFYGSKGDGNVYDTDNINTFESFVLGNTQGRGVHFMMADGGFSVDGQENIQEILSKQLYLCQCLVALSIVRIEGHFVVKLFDLFTPFSVGLIYLMHKCFHHIAIHKPNTSRPANSERYLICKWKRDDTTAIKEYLHDVNTKLNSQKSKSKQDIMELVPVSVLKEDELFNDFIIESNNQLAERQIINLVKIRSFCQDCNLLETRQTEMKRKCLEFWQVPDKTRTAPKLKSPDEKARELLKTVPSVPTFIKNPEQELTVNFLHSQAFNIYDYKCMVLASNHDNRNNCTFFLGLGRGHVYSYDKIRNCWVKCLSPLELSPGTLLYGEIVYELRGERGRQVKIAVLQIIDAASLGNKDISSYHLNIRHKWCEKFALAINKTTKHELMKITVKQLFKLEELDGLFSRLNYKGIKAFSGSSKLSFMLPDDDKFFLPGGLLFLKITREPWMMVMSRKAMRKYWFNRSTSESTFNCPPDCMEKFDASYSKRMVWWWDESLSLYMEDPAPENSDKVHRATIMDRVQTLMNR